MDREKLMEVQIGRGGGVGGTGVLIAEWER